MRKITILIFLLLISFALVACNDTSNDPTIPTDPTVVPSDPTVIPSDPPVADSAFALLMEAEDLSGMKNRMNSVIRTPGSLGLPTEYRGVIITYSSRVPSIISNNGEVTLPTECWIESRDQQGLSRSEFQGLNDNWPVVLDVLLSYQGQQRTAKLLFVVAPAEGYTCDKYLG